MAGCNSRQEQHIFLFIAVFKVQPYRQEMGEFYSQSMSIGFLLVAENCTFRGQDRSIQKLVK